MNDKLAHMPEKGPGILDAIKEVWEIFTNTKEKLGELKDDVEKGVVSRLWSWLKGKFGFKTPEEVDVAKLEKATHKEVAGYVSEAAKHYGINNNRYIVPMMLAICDMESDFDTSAQHQSSHASGLFQFMPHTGKPMLADLPSSKFGTNLNYDEAVFNKEINTWMAVKLLINNAKRLGIDLNKISSEEEAREAILPLYIAHNSGYGNVAAVQAAQAGDYSKLNEITKGKKTHWLNKRPKKTLEVQTDFDKYWSKLA